MVTSQYYITAYGLAVKRGFKGSLDDWIDSLHGSVFIKFADKLPECDEDMKDEPGNWLGILSGPGTMSGAHYDEYKWVNIKGSANAAVIAPAFDAAKSYDEGETVSYGEEIYRCKVKSTPGSLNPAEWEKTTLAQSVEQTGFNNSVSYLPQSKSEDEKEIARGNINALSAADGAVKSENIGSGEVKETNIYAGAVTETKLGAGAVTKGKLGEGAVEADNIEAGAVTKGKLGQGAVETDNIEDRAVGTEKLADRAVNGAKLQLNNGDLGEIILTKSVHYFDTLPSGGATMGKIIFVKAAT